MQQLPLNFSCAPDFRQEDFAVAETNREAYQWIMRWPDWPAHALIMSGPASCGKSHLAHIWAGHSGAIHIPPHAIGTVTSFQLMGEALCGLIDDAHRVTDEKGLFHLLNFAAETGRSLLLVMGREPPYGFMLKDVLSRLAALPVITVPPPDDALLEALLHKYFADRQLRVSPHVVQYLVAHMERSFSAAAQIVHTLDTMALSEKKNITLPFVRQVLAHVDM